MADNRQIVPGHDGVCEVCGGTVACEEPDCLEAPGHAYIHKECIRNTGDRYADELPEADFYGD